MGLTLPIPFPIFSQSGHVSAEGVKLKVWVSLRFQVSDVDAVVIEAVAELKLEQHPDKTFIGRVSRGFDFPGYLLTPRGW